MSRAEPLAVSVTKVPRAKGAWYYAASSMIGLAKLKTDEFLSHNVIVGEDLRAIAKAIALSFAGIRLRLAFGEIALRWSTCRWRLQAGECGHDK
jgi:hypothetical protein